MALAYTAPTWEDGSGTGISASQLQAISDCIEGLVQGTDKAIHSFSMAAGVFTLVFADGSEETVPVADLKGIVSIAKTSTSGNVDTYTITYTDGTTSTFLVTNGRDGAIQYTAGNGISIEDDIISANVDEWTEYQTVSSGAVTFTGLDDTQGYGYEPYVEVTDSSTNKNPSMQISTMSGSGTASMSIAFTTDADEGAKVWLRILK